LRIHRPEQDRVSLTQADPVLLHSNNLEPDRLKPSRLETIRLWAMVASTALTPGLGREKYLKVVCVEKERLKSAPRVTGG
jgi:hypothetical protein